MGKKPHKKPDSGQQPTAGNQRKPVLPNPRNQQAAHADHVNEDTNQPVDSWRSYRNDSLTLQSITTQHTTPAFRYPAPVLNPMAVSFAPELFTQVSPASYAQSQSRPYQPYQPLRFSNGQHERQVLRQAKIQVVPQQARTLSTLVNAEANNPIPSIENHIPSWRQLGGIPINEALLRVSRSSVPRNSRTPTPPPLPKPTDSYIAQANLAPYATDSASQKLLVVLDLNGTLVYRKNRANLASMQIRPGVTHFLDYLFSNHKVMVYTSARPENAIGMVNRIIHPMQRAQLVAVWARDKLDLTKTQYNNKVQVYKKLEKIWEDPDIQCTADPIRAWDQSNTVLVDDSHLKASSQPYNLLQVSEFLNDKPKGNPEAQVAWHNTQQEILASLQAKLEILKEQIDVSRMIREWQVGKKEKSVRSTEHKIMSKQENIEPSEPSLLTPKSPIEISSDSDDEGDHQGGVEVRSVSPIDEAVWADLLAGNKTDKDVETLPRTPSSLGRQAEV